MKKIIPIALILIFSACQEKLSEIVLDQGYDFFPLAVGEYRVYQVEEEIYTGFVPDSSNYYLKEELVDSLVSSDGSIKYLMLRSKSLDSMKWESDSTWTAQRVKESLIVTENNVPFVKLTFPVKLGNTWDGNAYNTRAELSYFFIASEVYSLNGQSISSENLIDVVIADIPKNLVNQDQRFERYARGIGLVSKNYTVLRFCNVNCDQPGTVESGRIYKQNLISYGQR